MAVSPWLVTPQCPAEERGRREAGYKEEVSDLKDALVEPSVELVGSTEAAHAVGGVLLRDRRKAKEQKTEERAHQRNTSHTKLWSERSTGCP